MQPISTSFNKFQQLSTNFNNFQPISTTFNQFQQLSTSFNLSIRGALLTVGSSGGEAILRFRDVKDDNMNFLIHFTNHKVAAVYVLEKHCVKTSQSSSMSVTEYSDSYLRAWMLNLFGKWAAQNRSRVLRARSASCL